MNFHVNTTRFFLLSCLLGTAGLSHAGLMCFSNNLGNTGATPAAACGDTTGAPVTSLANTQGGNPIDLLSGNKYQLEADFPSLPGALGLEFRRSYNSQSREQGILGYGWRSTYELRLQDSGDKVQILQADGKRISFEVKAFPFSGNSSTPSATSSEVTTSKLFINRCVSSRPEDGWVERVPKGGWIWHLPSGDAYRFNVDTSPMGSSAIGRLASISNASHSAWTTLSYSAQDGALVSIADRAGRKVIFKHQLTKYNLPQISVITPIGQFEYFQDKQGNLAQVVYPDGRRVGYTYDPRHQGGDVHNITDKFQYVMQRGTNPNQKKWQKKLLGHWQYDTSDRAVLSEHADGVERLTVAYDTKSVVRPLVTTDKNQRFNNTITNSLGQKTVYTYHLDGTRYLVDKIIGAGCVTCGESNIAYTYINGGQIKSQRWLAEDVSFLRTLTYEYDVFGRVKSRSVQAVGADDAAHAVNYTYANDDLQSEGRVNGWLVKTVSEASILAGKQKVTTYDYDAKGNKIAETQTGYMPTGEPLKRQTKYGYTQEGKLAWEDGPLPNGKANSPKDSDVTVYGYDENGRLHDLTAPADQQITVLSYDQFNRPNQIRVKDGSRVVTMTNVYLPNSSLLTQMSMVADGLPTVVQRYSYDAQKRLIQIQKGQLITTFGYDESGRRAITITPDGITHKTQLDSENRVTRQETLIGKALLQQVTSEYLQKNTSTDAGDNSQNILLQSDLIGFIAKHGHANQYIWKEDSIGRVQLEQRDAQNRIRTKQLLQANTATISSLLASAKPLSAGFKQDFSKGAIRQQQAGLNQDGLYDDFGRLVIKNQPAQGLSLFKYDAADNMIAQINGKGQVEFRHYDAASRLVAIGSQPDIKAAKLLMSYDGTKIVKKISPTETQIWQYRADGLTTKHTRKLYLPKSAEDIQKAVLTKVSDKIIQPTRTWTLTWNYDENGLIGQETRHGLVLSYERDTLGRPTRIQTYADNGLMGTVSRWLHLNKYTISNIHYTPLGLLAGYTTSTGRTLSRTYDNRGRLKTQTWTGPQSATSITQQIKNWSSSKMIAHTDAYVYDSVNRLIYSSETGGHYYQYDARDQLIAEWQRKENQPSDQASAKSNAWEVTHQYAYDAQGNRRMYWAKYDQSEPSSLDQRTTQETLTHYHYADGSRNANNQVLLLGADKVVLTPQVKALQTSDSSVLPHLGRLIGYGETGQPVAWWQAEMPFNHLNDYARSVHGSPLYNTTQANWTGEDRDQSKVLIEQGQDINGMPLYKRARLKNGTLSDRGLNTRGFEQLNGYENGQRLWEEQTLSLPNDDNKSEDLNLSRDYIMLGGLPVAQLTNLNGDSEYSDIEFNHIGAPVAVYDHHNQKQWQIAYGAFGEKLKTEYINSPSTIQITAIRKQANISQNANDLRYAVSLRLPGQFEDPLTGLYDNGHRQYDSQMGRYLTPDPAGTPDGLNPYLYVNNNPINSIDPLGLYQTDMHYYMTYFLAITAGIDSDNARRIALAAQFVDVNDNTSPLPEGTGGIGYIPVEINNATTNRLDWYHFTNNREYYDSVGQGYDLGSWDFSKPAGMSDKDYLKWRLTSDLSGVPQLQTMTQNYKTAAGCKNMNLSMQFFGEYLHAFEDTFAHRDADNDPYGTNGGVGHAVGGENPDYTFNHTATGLGAGNWKNNEDRTLIAEQQIYAKLVEYRQTILKIPDNQTKVVPLSELQSYLTVFNAIPEHHDGSDTAGSLDGWKEKIQYLQDLLNGNETSVTTYKKDANGLVDPQNLTPNADKLNGSATNWGYKPKAGDKFQLITPGKRDGKDIMVAGTDGFSVPQAITNRIGIFKDLTVAQTEIYQNVIWDTYVKGYKSHDDEKTENADMVTNVQKYRLTSPLTTVFYKPTDKAFKVTGTPPTTEQTGQ